MLPWNTFTGTDELLGECRQFSSAAEVEHVGNGLYVNNRIFNNWLDQMALDYASLPSPVTNMQNDEMCDEVRRGCFLDEFKEAKEVTNIIASLSNIYTDQIAVERALERFQCEHVYLNNCLRLLVYPHFCIT